ncbi:MAG TPA: hypothetical protein VHW90_06910 [Stellaceae bacterium]|jgi:hypothetical protein|nr:hypothetical protein [Stellaceae bacterium]
MKKAAGGGSDRKELKSDQPLGAAVSVARSGHEVMAISDPVFARFKKGCLTAPQAAF